MMMDFYHTVANLLINKSLSANVYVYVFEYEGDLNWSSNKLKPFLPFYVKGIEYHLFLVYNSIYYSFLVIHM